MKKSNSKFNNKQSRPNFCPFWTPVNFLKLKFSRPIFFKWYFWTLYDPLCPGKPLPLLFFDFDFEKWQDVVNDSRNPAFVSAVVIFFSFLFYPIQFYCSIKDMPKLRRTDVKYSLHLMLRVVKVAQLELTFLAVMF